MRCHECDAPAAYAPQTDGIRVGLCEYHLQARLERFPGETIKRRLFAD